MKFYNNINLQLNQLVSAVVERVTTLPVGTKGRICYQTSDEALYFHNGTQWVQCGGGYGINGRSDGNKFVIALTGSDGSVTKVSFVPGDNIAFDIANDSVTIKHKDIEVTDTAITSVADTDVISINVNVEDDGHITNVNKITFDAFKTILSNTFAKTDLSNVTEATVYNKLSNYLGKANGIATLDTDGKVPSTQLPSYVDDVLEAASYAKLPNPGETGKIYVTTDNNKTYRWSGSAYVEITAAPGSTDSITEGTTNLYFTETRVKNTSISYTPASSNDISTTAKTDSLLTWVQDLADTEVYIKNNYVPTTRTINTTSPITGGGNLTSNRTIALADGYGDTKNPYGSKTKNTVLAAPASSNGTPSFRALTKADLPTLIQQNDTSLNGTSGTITIDNVGNVINVEFKDNDNNMVMVDYKYSIASKKLSLVWSSAVTIASGAVHVYITYLIAD